MVVAAGLGREIAHGQTRLVLAAVGVCVVAALWQRGVVIALLVLVSVNGLPGIDTSAFVGSRLTGQDFGVIALLSLGVFWTLTEPRQRVTRTALTVTRFAILLLGWWTIEELRSAVIDHVSLIRAAAFGRQYLYFALLIMVLPRVRLSARDLIWMLRVLAAGAVVYAIGQILASLNIVQLTSLIHPAAVSTTGGLTRIYSYVTYLVVAGVALGVAAALVGTRGVRRAAIPILAVLLTSVLVQQGRALWAGLVVGVLLATLWLNGRAQGQLVRRLRGRGATIVVLAVATVAIALVADGAAIEHGALAQRAISAFSAIESNQGTVAIRTNVVGQMFSVLGGRWPIGVGFIPTSAHYFSSLPNGSLFDPDIGVVNALMTIGGIGTLLIYAVMVVCLREAFSSLRASGDGAYPWLRYGISIWIVSTLVSSITLTTLFVTGGITLSALMIALLLTWTDTSEIGRAPRAAPPDGAAVRDSWTTPAHPSGARRPPRAGRSAWPARTPTRFRAPHV